MRRSVLVLYPIVELLIFIALVRWIGFLSTVGLVVLLTIGGILLAIAQLRSSVVALARVSRKTPERLLSIGLTAAGAVLVGVPGFITLVLGLILIFPPTRSLVQPLVSQALKAKVAQFGVRSAAWASTRGQRFRPVDDPSLVIDEDEVQQWLATVEPEDFTDGSGNRGSQS